MTLDSLRLALADIVIVTRRALLQFGEDGMAQRSAALAYYAFFSVFPLLLLAISLLGFMLEAGVPLAVDAQTAALQAVEQTLPEAKELVERAVTTTRTTRGGTGLIGLIVLAWSASNIFTQARLALNAVWNVGVPKGLGGVLQLRLKGLGMALATGLLLFVFTLSDTILGVIAGYATRLPWSDALWPVGQPLLLASATVILFAVLYRFLPYAPLSWVDVWPGAIVAGVGWEVLKHGFVWYTTSVADWSAVYGPVTGAIGLLLWLYLSAHVLLFGAEFAAAYRRLLDDKRTLVPIATTVTPAIIPDEQPLIQGSVAPSPAGLSSDHPASPAGLARGTAAGLVGAGMAGALVIVGLLATGWRLLSRRTPAEPDHEKP